MWNLIPFERRHSAMQNYFDNFEKNFFGDLGSGFSTMRTDVLDKGDSFEVCCELPGFDKKDISLGIEDDCLVISAEHSTAADEENKSYVRRERRYGSFRRSFSMEGIDVEGITANYRNGILSIDLPKAKVVTVPGRRIEIGE